jgi:hypothetical protein
MGKGGSRLRGRERGSKDVRTVAVTIMRRHFLAYRDRPDHAEGNVAPLTEEFAIVVAVMLSLFFEGKRGTGRCRVSNECIRIGEAQVGKRRRKGLRHSR